ncbi:MAG: tRNA (adenosine(37)-N6)-threonylcarbamoyltransferase complex transferase subunit TsaD [Burkholderiales bacterium]|jgi:N6-L-threonylcarbamoyladenine synthase|nr:tRNA (adenosine(37)-N6)-threonylcarbamoyltransferase complex transferase subunit TsaD [Burkholderiales bacterium]
MLVLGIETSCDETGLAVYDTTRGLLAHALHSQVAMHEEYGGVVPELASRDHIRRVLPLAQRVLGEAGAALGDLDAIAYTEGPGLAGALLVGASIAASLAYALRIPAIGVHHLEGHLLSPLLSQHPPPFPFVALLVSGGHTQLMRVAGVGRYELLGETLDDAAGEAFDKTAQLLGLGYPGGPAIARLADTGMPGRFRLPRPMLASGDLDFSFSGLKTAVRDLVRGEIVDAQTKADLARELQAAIADVLVAKSLAAIRATGLPRLVVAGGVGANRHLRAELDARAVREGFEVFYPELELCTDNGAMIALAGALRLQGSAGSRQLSALVVRPQGDQGAEEKTQALGRYGFTVKPRWDLETLPPASPASGH